MNYQYSQEAQKRISALGQATIVTFIEDVPLNIRKDAYKILPKVQGFRPNSPAELKEKQKRLITHLAHPQLSVQKTTDWVCFAYIWYSWAKHKLGEDFPTGESIDSTSESGLAFFLELKKLFPEAEREIIEQLFMFSCFPEHANTNKIFTHFKTAKVIERERMINGFSSRLEQIEQSFNKLKNNTLDAIKRLDNFEPCFSSFNDSLEETIRKSNSNSKEINLLRDGLENNFKKIDFVQGVVDSFFVSESDVKKEITEVSLQVSSLKMDIHELSINIKELQEEKKDLMSIKNIVTGLLEREKQKENSLKVIDDLIAQVTMLEGMSLNQSNEADIKQTNRLVEYEVEGDLVDISSVKEACNLVAFNLKAVGVIKSEVIARQIIATFIAGQIVQFSGSLANLIADAVAAAIGGPIYHEWRVPIGLIDGDKGTDYIEKTINTSGCLILKGVNLSAFEVYGTEIRDIVIRRQYGFLEFGRLALIATWTKGPATFPDGGTVTELGPLFDTDTIKMRGVINKFPSWKYGNLSEKNWNTLEGLEFDEALSKVDDLKEILREVNFEGGNLWRRLIVNYLQILSAIPSDVSKDDLHFLLVSWIIPWARILGEPVVEITRIAERELVEQREISD